MVNALEILVLTCSVDLIAIRLKNLSTMIVIHVRHCKISPTCRNCWMYVEIQNIDYMILSCHRSLWGFVSIDKCFCRVRKTNVLSYHILKAITKAFSCPDSYFASDVTFTIYIYSIIDKLYYKLIICFFGIASIYVTGPIKFIDLFLIFYSRNGFRLICL